MSTAAPALGTTPRFQPPRGERLAALARDVLLVLILLLYVGVERLLNVWSPALHYGFDALVVVAAALALLRTPVAGATVIRRMGAYLGFLVLFFGWTVMVSPQPDGVLGQAVGAVALNLLLLGAVSLVLVDRRSVVRMASVLQIGSIVGLAFSLYELATPRFVRDLALAANPHTPFYNDLRPAGLWLGPNEAAIAFLVGFMMSFWTRGPLAWVGRFAAVVGIFLTSSREVEYPLIVFIGVYAGIRLALGSGTIAARLRRGVIGLVAVAAALGLAFAAISSIGGSAGAYALDRFLDIGQTHRLANDPSRADLAGQYGDRVLKEPWHGSGAFSFQGTSAVLGAHNMYLVVWGEGGIALLVLYVAVLASGPVGAARSRVRGRDKLLVISIWMVYGTAAAASHNFFTSVYDVLFLGVLLNLAPALEVARGASASQDHATSMPVEAASRRLAARGERASGSMPRVGGG